MEQLTRYGCITDTMIGMLLFIPIMKVRGITIREKEYQHISGGYMPGGENGMYFFPVKEIFRDDKF